MHLKNKIYTFVFSFLMAQLLWLQSNSGTKAKEDLAAATRAVEVWSLDLKF